MFPSLIKILRSVYQVLLFHFLDGGFGYDQNPTQFQAHARTTPQQPPPPYSKNPYQQGFGKPQYPGQFQGNPNQNQMANPGMKPPSINRQQFMQHFMRKPPQQQNPNMTASMANMMGPGGFNKPNFPNQVGRSTDRKYIGRFT